MHVAVRLGSPTLLPGPSSAAPSPPALLAPCDKGPPTPALCPHHPAAQASRPKPTQTVVVENPASSAPSPFPAPALLGQTQQLPCPQHCWALRWHLRRWGARRAGLAAVPVAHTARLRRCCHSAPSPSAALRGRPRQRGGEHCSGRQGRRVRRVRPEAPGWAREEADAATDELRCVHGSLCGQAQLRRLSAAEQEQLLRCARLTARRAAASEDGWCVRLVVLC